MKNEVIFKDSSVLSTIRVALVLSFTLIHGSDT